MKKLLNDKELIDNILEFDKYGDPDIHCIFSTITTEKDIKVIRVDIWESEFNSVDVVVTAIKNKNGISVIGGHKAFIVCSFDMNKEIPEDVKNEGRRLKKILLRNFRNKGIKVTSNLHYNG